MQEAVVSVVIPAYDRAPLLRRALLSVFAQTRPADEIVVVDDGSTDETAELVACEFPQVVYLHRRHGGVSAARNTGIEAARGDWLALLDSDDEWRPRKLERQLAALASEPDFKLCHTDEVWIRDGARVNPKQKHAKRGGWIFQHCLALCAISPSSAVIHSSLFDDAGMFDETLPACEDYDLWLRTCARYPVLYLDEALTVKHGGHADQLSRRHWGMDRFRIRALQKVIDSGVLAPADRYAAIEMLCRKVHVYLQGARKRHKHAEVSYYERLLSRHDSSHHRAGV